MSHPRKTINSKRKFPSQCSASPAVYNGSGHREGQGDTREAGREPSDRAVCSSGSCSLHNSTALPTAAEPSGPAVLWQPHLLTLSRTGIDSSMRSGGGLGDFGFYLPFELTPAKSNDFSNPATIRVPASTNVTNTFPVTRVLKMDSLFFSFLLARDTVPYLHT